MSRDITTVPPIAADERIAYGSEPSQFFDLFRAKGIAQGSVVMIHGGFWRAKYDLLHASHLCADLAHRGWNVANLEFRRVGEPGGGWPNTYKDVLSGIGAATKHFGSAPVLVGHSAGGHLALRAAIDLNEIIGVVALAPVAVLKIAYDLNLSNGAVEEFLGGTPETVPERFADACSSLHASVVARTLVHGTDDDTVPISISREFVKRRSADPGKVELCELVGVNHFDLINPESTAWSEVLSAVWAMLSR